MGPVHDYAWEPTPERIAEANVTRLMRAAGVETIDDLRRRSVEDIDWYWDLVAKDLALPFDEPYTRVRDSSRGIEWTTWFVDGEINVATACVDRWRDDPEVGPAAALIYEDETGRGRKSSATPSSPRRSTGSPAGLRRAGIDKGDSVAVFLPMCPQAVIAAYAIAKVGALYLPLFSGFASAAISARINDAQARLVFTTDWSWRRGKQAPLKPAWTRRSRSARASRQSSWSSGTASAARAPIDVPWDEFAAPVDGPEPAERTSRRGRAAARLHVGHDGEAEGRGPHPRRVPRSRSPRRSRTSSTSSRATSSSGSPTWAGSWDRSARSARMRWARRCCSTRARPTYPTTDGCGTWSSATA